MEFTYLQKLEIQKGRRNGLSKCDIQLYAKRKFNFLKMQEIRLGLEHGLTYKQVKHYAHPHKKVPWMKEVRIAYETRHHPPSSGRLLYWCTVLCVFLSCSCAFAWSIAKEKVFPVEEPNPTQLAMIEKGPSIITQEILDNQMSKKGIEDIPVS